MNIRFMANKIIKSDLRKKYRRMSKNVCGKVCQKITCTFQYKRGGASKQKTDKKRLRR